MGNVLIDLDQRFGKFQFKYLDVYAKREFELAASLLYQGNCNLPFDARVLDMPAFQADNSTYRSQNQISVKAREYCDKWAPLVWTSIADYTKEMIDRLQD